MNNFFFLLFFSLQTFISPSLLAGTLSDPGEILKKNEEARQISNVEGNVTLTTKGGSETNQKKFTWMRKLSEDGKRFKTFTRFHEPATVKNQGILFIERENYDSDIFLYLPTYKKTRRVESHSQSSSFMGSAFSYADIATPLSEDFNSKLLKTEHCPGLQSSCYVIEQTPKTKNVEERTGYKKNVQWIDANTFMTTAWDFYEADTTPRKKMRAKNFKAVDPAKKKWIALNLEIEDNKTKKSTSLVFDSINTSKVIPDNTFTQQNLQRER